MGGGGGGGGGGGIKDEIGMLDKTLYYLLRAPSPTVSYD